MSTDGASLTTSGFLENLYGLSGKVALVTGGTSGIGRTIAEAFLRAGARVYITSRSPESCAQTVLDLSPLGPCDARAADLSHQEECERLSRWFLAREPCLHILVNNAGTAWGAPLDDHDDAVWSRVLDLNVKGSFHLTRYLHEALVAAAEDGGPARVINIGSTDGLRAPPMESYAYAASKAGLHHLTRHLANRLAPRVTVNAIAPGAFESRMTQAVLRTHGSVIIDDTPMRRIGHPDDIAGAALYLASRAGGYVTGTILVVDGGLSVASRRRIAG